MRDNDPAPPGLQDLLPVGKSDHDVSVISSELALCPALVVIIWLPHKADLGVKKDLTDISQYIEITCKCGLFFQ